MILIDEVPLTADTTVYPEGWQSWSPVRWYDLSTPAHRPTETWQHLMRFRPGVPIPEQGWQGEGLLVVDPGDGAPARVYATLDASTRVPSIHAQVRGERLLVHADGPVDTWSVPASDQAPGPAALADVGDALGRRAGARLTSEVPRVWCTWYRYFEQVTAADVLENLRGFDDLGLDVDVVQIDDGWSLGTGAWTAPNPRFGSLPDAVAAILDSGRRAGIWLAPFCVGSRSEVALDHPDWLTGPAGHNWGDDLVGLDLTHPGVQDHLASMLTRLRELCVDYLKLDFLYAGAVPGARHQAEATGVSAYRTGLELIRDVMGPDAYLLGCGAPLLPSVGRLDAMRVSPDTFHEGGEDGSQGLRGRMSLEARAWQDSRWWTNDPDCLVARESFALRDAWAEVVLAAPGVRGFSDRLSELDPHGLDLVRQLLGNGAR